MPASFVFRFFLERLLYAKSQGQGGFHGRFLRCNRSSVGRHQHPFGRFGGPEGAERGPEGAEGGPEGAEGDPEWNQGFHEVEPHGTADRLLQGPQGAVQGRQVGLLGCQGQGTRGLKATATSWQWSLHPTGWNSPFPCWQGFITSFYGELHNGLDRDVVCLGLCPWRGCCRILWHRQPSPLQALQQGMQHLLGKGRGLRGQYFFLPFTW